MRTILTHISPLLLAMLLMASCSIVKYVPDGESLLIKNKIVVDEKKKVSPSELKPYLRQTTNKEVFSFMKVKLATYSLSTPDTTKRFNRWLRRIGEPPVIYDPYLVEKSEQELTKQLVNKGYMCAQVKSETTTKKKRTRVTYNVTLNAPYIINRYELVINDDSARYFISHSSDSLPIIKEGDIFDLEKMDEERSRLVKILRNNGYYNLKKEMLYYEADTFAMLHTVNIKLSMHESYEKNDSLFPYMRKKIRKVLVQIENIVGESLDNQYVDSVESGSYKVVYGDKRFIRANILSEKVYIEPNTYYAEQIVAQTYNSINFLPAVKYVNISFSEVGMNELDCKIIVNPDKVHVLAAEIEGTNSEGDIGAAANLNYQNKNIFRGSEVFKIAVRGAYETMGLTSNHLYHSWDVGGNIGLTFPRFLFPMKMNTRKSIQANTELSIGYNHQTRPQYTREIANANFKYIWNSFKNSELRYTFDLFDLSYVYIPKMNDTFRTKYMVSSSMLRFSYEDHLILKWGLGLTYSNKVENKRQDFYSIRTRMRTAGNLLYGICSASSMSKVVENVGSEKQSYYTLGEVRFSQFAKGDFDFSYTKFIGERQQLAFHTAFGVACPYGNANVLPFEERYFSGGANSVRGWSVRTLGPGSFKNKNGVIDFMAQSGDIKLDLSLEYRIKLFWIIEGALFMDAGNIWTIKEYDSQEGGAFLYKRYVGDAITMWQTDFYKQIAWSYGLGVRADFKFFILRFDFGFKLYDPSRDDGQRWVAIRTKDDFAFHFAIGYPF